MKSDNDKDGYANIIEGAFEGNDDESRGIRPVANDESKLVSSRDEERSNDDEDGLARIEAALKDSAVTSSPPPPPTQPSPLVYTQYCVLSMLIGALLSVQVQMNSQASIHFKIDIFGSFLTFIMATVILTVLVFIEKWYLLRVGIPQLPVLRWTKTPNIYNLLPGLLGVTYVTGTITISKYIGVSLMWIPVVVGQITCSILLDAFVGFNGVKNDITYQKGFSVILVFIGAVLSVLDSILNNKGSTVHEGGFAACILAALFLGIIIPIQSYLNRDASLILPSRIQATWWSFFIGDIFVTIVFIIQMCINDEAANSFPARFRDSEPMIYFGGLLGSIFIASTIIVTAKIGVGPFFVCIVCGQLIGSAIIQSIGALNSKVVAIGTMRIIGIICVIAAAALQQLRLVFSTEISDKSGIECGSVHSVHSIASLDSSMHFRDI
jgi:bacterial/archaeal transporter family-2 protein